MWKQKFKNNQKFLLWLCNTAIVRVWFRWLLGISIKEKITRLYPQGFDFVDQGVHKKRFYGKNFFSLQLHHSFYWIWKAMHIWDLFVDRYAPSLSFGFATLIQFSYPVDTDFTTVDGTITNDNGDTLYNTARISGTGTTAFPTATSGFIQNAISGGTYILSRGVFLFESTLDPGDTVSGNVTFYYYVVSRNFDVTTPDAISVVGSTPASNTTLVVGDYIQVGDAVDNPTVLHATLIDMNNHTVGAYMSRILNATGVALLTNSIVKLGLRTTEDCTNVNPSPDNQYIEVYMADNGVSTAPYLEIIFTPRTQPNYTGDLF